MVSNWNSRAALARCGRAMALAVTVAATAALAACTTSMQPGPVAGARSTPLVSAQWLQQQLGSANLVLLDASPTPAYRKEHIPGAIGADIFSFGPETPSPEQMQERMRTWGISAGSRVVIYDGGASYAATHIFFDLYYHGFPASDVFVLDGGLAKWKEIGGAVTAERTAAPAKGTYEVGKLREETRIRLTEFFAASGNPARHVVVDALEPPSYFGGTKFFDRGGHVPNAVLWSSEDFFNADKTFKSPAEIQRMLDYHGIRRDQGVHSYCGGGVAATVPYFAVKFLAGYPNVTVYRESQREWLRDERQLPLWTYGAPYLARDPAWLNSWGAPVLRMYGVSKLSLIDVRPADAYGLGHIPYALNVPADVFRKFMDQPEQLSAALGAAGVNPVDEVVIVADKGLTEGAALAFVALERLGHRKVSVLMDSIDDWGLRGFPLTKEPTIVGPRKSPKDIAVPAATKRANVRADVLAKDGGQGSSAAAAGGSGGSRGQFPKVYLASGKQPPAKTLAGKVVHVPYTQMLNADGRPKSASDLWTLLTKAGVPRYAEIVAVADDPGEAAVAYYIVRLMGFPDVKMLAPS